MLDPSDAERLEVVIDNLLSDAGLAPYQTELEFIAFSVDDDTPSRLNSFYDQHIDEFRATAVQPETDLAKCVTVDRFVRNYASADVRAEYQLLPRDSYLHDLRSAQDSHAQLRADLSEAPLLIPAPFSWLFPADDLAGLPSLEITHRLRLKGANNPLVMFLFPLDLLITEGVRVRAPSAIDTIPAMDDYWLPDAVPHEQIDGDLPRATCGDVKCLD